MWHVELIVAKLSFCDPHVGNVFPTVLFQSFLRPLEISTYLSRYYCGCDRLTEHVNGRPTAVPNVYIIEINWDAWRKWN